MPKTKRLGRPPTEHPRVHVIPSRYNDAELAKLRTAALQAGMPVAAYIRHRALSNAERQDGDPTPAAPRITCGTRPELTQ